MKHFSPRLQKVCPITKDFVPENIYNLFSWLLPLRAALQPVFPWGGWPPSASSGILVLVLMSERPLMILTDLNRKSLVWCEVRRWEKLSVSVRDGCDMKPGLNSHTAAFTHISAVVSVFSPCGLAFLTCSCSLVHLISLPLRLFFSCVLFSHSLKLKIESEPKPQGSRLFQGGIKTKRHTQSWRQRESAQSQK